MEKKSKYNLYVQDNGKFCVANTLTGSLIELNSLEYSYLQNGQYNKLQKEAIQLLKHQGILVPIELDETALLRHTYLHCRFDNSVARLTICPTLDCNFACPYCYQTRQKGVMGQDVQDGVIKFLEDAVLKAGVKQINVTWYGGEPLLCFDIIKTLTASIINLCNEYNASYKISMITNGYLLNKQVIQTLEEIGLSTIQITIDGDETTHNSRRKLHSGKGTFNKIVKNIHLLAQTTVFTLVRVNIDRSNLNSFKEVKPLFESYENVHCYPAMVTLEKTQKNEQRSLCFAHNEYKEIYQFLDRTDSNRDGFDSKVGRGVTSCAAEHKYSFVIDPNGFVYKCLNDIGDISCIVDAINQRFEETTDSIAIAKYLGRDPFTEEKCCECEYLPLCYGGCVWEYKDKGTHSCCSEKFVLENLIKQTIDT